MKKSIKDKKIIFPKFSKVTFIISTVLICIYFFISCLEKHNIYFYCLEIGTMEIAASIKIICVTLLASASIVLICSNINYKFLCIVMTAIIFSLALVCCGLISFSELSFNSQYYEYTSDDNNHRIVVNEYSWLLGGGGKVYEKTSFCTMKEVGNYSTDDGFCPLATNAFYFIWNEDSFELHHAFLDVSDDKSMYKVVEMEYVK